MSQRKGVSKIVKLRRRTLITRRRTGDEDKVEAEQEKVSPKGGGVTLLCCNYLRTRTDLVMVWWLVGSLQKWSEKDEAVIEFVKIRLSCWGKKIITKNAQFATFATKVCTCFKTRFTLYCMLSSLQRFFPQKKKTVHSSFLVLSGKDCWIWSLGGSQEVLCIWPFSAWWRSNEQTNKQSGDPSASSWPVRRQPFVKKKV